MNINTPLLCNNLKIIVAPRIFEPNMQAFEDKNDFVPILQKH